MADAGGKVGGLGGDIQQAVVGDQRRRFGVVEDECRFVPAVGGVDGNGDAAEQGQAEPGVEDFGDIGQEQGNAVAVPDAELAEHSGGGAAAAVEIGVGNLLAGDFHEHLVGVGGDDGFQELAQGFLPGLAAGDGVQAKDGVHRGKLGRGGGVLDYQYSTKPAAAHFRGGGRRFGGGGGRSRIRRGRGVHA